MLGILDGRQQRKTRNPSTLEPETTNEPLMPVLHPSHSTVCAARPPPNTRPALAQINSPAPRSRAWPMILDQTRRRDTEGGKAAEKNKTHRRILRLRLIAPNQRSPVHHPPYLATAPPRKTIAALASAADAVRTRKVQAAPRARGSVLEGRTLHRYGVPARPL